MDVDRLAPEQHDLGGKRLICMFLDQKPRRMPRNRHSEPSIGHPQRPIADGRAGAEAPIGRRGPLGPIRETLSGIGGLFRRQYYRGPVSDHFDGVQFIQPDGVPLKRLSELIRWWREPGRPSWPARVENAASDRPPARVEGAELRVAFVGHATLLIQTGGLNILTDPVWSERASPFRFAGPKRVRDPGIAFAALPPIDAVLVSHAHYDHLDVATLSRLAAVHAPRVITLLGNDAIMRAYDSAIVAEAYDWGDRAALGEAVAATPVPVRHWSSRGPFDRNRSLWGGFVLETPAGGIFYAADTGYGDGSQFRHVREKYGPLRLAILPIGAYEPRWLMRDQHMNPAEAVRAFIDCGAEHALAHHFGTFHLTNEAIDAPAQALAVACAAAGFAAGRFRVLSPGEALTYPA
jgi:L-ascorbate metabolism protein UlaG (beta-lactamase superfamily)